MASVIPLPLPRVPGVRHDWIDLPTGVHVHVAEAGRRSAPPILALHGFPQHWWMWRDVIPLLADDFRIICPDMRGFGWSGQPADRDFRKQRMAEDALALIDALSLEQVGLLGHDWGAWTGWLLALDAPERISAFLALSAVHPWQRASMLLVAGRRMPHLAVTAAPGVGAAVARDGRLLFRELEPVMGGVDARAFLAPLRQPEQAHASSALHRQFLLRELPYLPAAAHDRTVELPVHILLGRHDTAREPRQLRRLRAHAPCATVEVVDSGHFLVDERPGLVAARARALFSGPPAEGAAAA